MKKCQFCKKDIAINSKVCKYCGEEQDSTAIKKKSKLEQEVEKAKEDFKSLIELHKEDAALADKVAKEFGYEGFLEAKLSIDTGPSTIPGQIKDHMEFFGYDYEIKLLDNDLIQIIYKHENKTNFIIVYNKYSNLSFIRNIIFLDHSKNIKLDNDFHFIFNKINSESSFTKRYYDIDDDKLLVLIESTFRGYEKKIFGDFIDNLITETKKYAKRFETYYEER